MRQIGTIPSQQQARHFEDYLLTKGIKATVEEEADAWTVWIHDEDDVVPAKEKLAKFLDSPDDPQYQRASASAADLRKQEQQKNKQGRKQQIDVRQRWSRPMAQACPVTYAMIGLSVIVAFGTRLGDQPDPLQSMLSIASFDGGRWIIAEGLQDLASGEVWRLVTPMFLHFSIMHIFFNMLWLRQLGAMVEFRHGSPRFALIVLTIAAASNLSEFYVDLDFSFSALPIRLKSNPFFGGMSGVVFGLFGYIWIKGRIDPASGLFLPRNTVILMMVWFFLCMTGFVGNIANMAHGVGLITGFLLAYGSLLQKSLRR